VDIYDEDHGLTAEQKARLVLIKFSLKKQLTGSRYMGMTLRSNGVPIAFSTRLPSRKQMEKQW
jgi:hypothetical protein